MLSPLEVVFWYTVRLPSYCVLRCPHNILYTKNVCFRTDISSSHACRRSLANFSPLNSRWNSIRLFSGESIPACVCGQDMHSLLLFLPSCTHIASLIFSRYPLWFVHRSTTFCIWGQIQYDIYNSIAYVINFPYPIWTTTSYLVRLPNLHYFIKTEVVFSTHS